MACETWRGRIQAYADGELPAVERKAFEAHQRTCTACAASAAEQLQWKRALRQAGNRYAPSPAFRRRVEQSLVSKPKRSWGRMWVPAFVAAAVLIVALLGVARWQAAARQQTFNELADLHAGALASSAPVDVVSSDRHTVKPWFAGRIPFSFDLPDLANSDFTLLGGRVAFLNQESAAHLLFQIRQHRISVFIVPDRQGALRWLGQERTPSRKAAFTVETWSAGGLRYFAISDVASKDLHRLAELMRAAIH